MRLRITSYPNEIDRLTMTASRIDSFEIVPYTGALPLRFGMSSEDVHSALGKPHLISTLWNKSGFSHSWDSPELNVGFTNDNKLNQVGFAPRSIALSINGIRIWSPQDFDDPNPILLHFDPNPRAFVGFLVYLEIGVTTTGFHDNDPTQYALCVFPRGAYDDMSSKTTAPDLTKYSMHTNQDVG